MSTLLIEDSLDTARMIAACRAVEHERAGALFRDPYARRLAGKRGEEILRKLPPGEIEVAVITARTCTYDEMLLHTIERDKVDTVLNLGAGLDTRPYRLPLPSSLRWIEADRSEVLAYKEELLADAQPSCILERVALDITNARERKHLLTRIGEQAQRIFVLAEGLLIYLKVEQVAALAADLRAQPTIGWWLTEFVSEMALRRSGWNNLASSDAQRHFSPPGGVEFFRLHGWKVAEFRLPLLEVARLKAPVHRKWRIHLLRLLSSLLKQEGETLYAQGGFFLFAREEVL